MSFPFFGQNFTSVFMASNGLLSFGEGLIDISPGDFPFRIPILAVFWTDLIAYNEGKMIYRSLLRNPGTENVFVLADKVVRQAFGNKLNFSSSWMMIATWYNVSYYGEPKTRNTFQAVIMTDGRHAFTIFNYKEIDSTTRKDAKVGYDAADGITYYSVPESMTDKIYNIEERTNIGTRGRWLFRLDIEVKMPVVVCSNDTNVIINDGMTDVSVIWSPLPSAKDSAGGVIDPANIICEDQDGDPKLSGDRFRAGITTITCTTGTHDTGPYQGSCQFTISFIAVTLVCPPNKTIPTLAGNKTAQVTWQEPELTGWDETNFTSASVPGDTFSIGSHIVTYKQWFGINNLVLTCSFGVNVIEVGLVCPLIKNLPIRANPGENSSSVFWQDPDITGLNGSSFTSTAKSGDVFVIGTHNVTYDQWFGINNLHLTCSFNFSVVGQCVSEVTNDTRHGDLSWLDTMAGTEAKSVQRCELLTKNAGHPKATRNCSTDASPRYFSWEQHVRQSCGESEKTISVKQVVQVSVSAGNAKEVAEFLSNQTASSQDTSEDKVEAISTILKNIVEAGSGDTEVTKAVIETVANVITNAKENKGTPDSKSSSAIVKSVEAQVALTLKEGGDVSIKQDAIHVKAVSIDRQEASKGFSFVSVQQESAGTRSPKEGSLDGTEIKTFTNASEVPKEVVASIQLPATILDHLPQSIGNMSMKVSFIVYADDTLFQTGVIKDLDGLKNLTSKVAGSIVSLSIEGVELKNLTDPVVIDFKAPTNASEEDLDTIKCTFWEFGGDDEAGYWSTEGCRRAEITTDKISCECGHATNFAILMDVKGQQLTDEGFSSTPALDIISQIGGALSVIALSLTLVIYLSIRKLRTGKSRQIFIHFCFSLLLLYLVFLAGVDNARGSGGGCVFVAALLHYLTLTTMMWMAVEARNMYVSTVKVFPEDTHLYMVKAGLLAWGSPFILLIITLSAATQFYQNEHYCFISPGLAMYLGLLTPIAFILLHNVITFILVMRSLLKVKEASRSEQITKRLQNAVGISALMGLTWCFGFLAIEGAAFTFQLLFCLTNSLQGVLVGVMFCARREEVRVALAPYLRRICCGRECRLPIHSEVKPIDLTTSQTAPNTMSTAQTTNLDISVSASPREAETETR